MQGQINLDSALGKLINMMVRSKSTIVEIGTWNGQGSTLCVIDALQNRSDDYQFYTVECNRDRYYESFNYWSTVLTPDQLSKIHFLFGSILKPSEIPTVEQISHKQGFIKEWYDQDVQAITTSACVLDQIPSEIDMLILDGGEYTTYAEFVILKSRTKIVFLDDTTTFKCSLIRQELLVDPAYLCVADVVNDRNGYAVFRKVV